MGFVSEIAGAIIGGALGSKGGSSKTTTQVTPAPQTQFQMDLESSFRDWLFGSLSSGDKIRQLQAKKQSLIAQRQALVRYAGTAGYSDQSVGFGPEGDPDIGGGRAISDDISAAIGIDPAALEGANMGFTGNISGGGYNPGTGGSLSGGEHGGLQGLGGYDVL